MILRKSKISFIPIIILLVVGVFSLGESTIGARLQGQHYFDVRIYLYIFFAFLITMNLRKNITLQEFIIISLILVFVAIKLILGFQSDLFYSYFISFSPFILMAALLTLKPSHVNVDLSHIQRVVAFILGCFLIKYTYMQALGFTNRPQLITENNIELAALLLGLSSIEKLNKTNFGMLVLVILLSGSLSACAAFLVYYVSKYRIRFGAIFFSFPVILYFIYVFLLSKVMHYGSIADIDRVLFSIVFFEEISSRNLPEIFLGDIDMSGLNPKSCSSLIGYEHMFGSQNSHRFSCTSLPLHGSFFRILLDHGIVGLCIFVMGLWYFLKCNYQSFLPILLIFVVTGLSISSLHNVLSFVALGIALFAYRDGTKEWMVKNVKT